MLPCLSRETGARDEGGQNPHATIRNKFMEHVYVAVGSNLGDRVANVTRSFNRISDCPDYTQCRLSSLFINPAVGPGEQPDYVNGVIEFKTQQAPLEVLKYLQDTENELGRVRNVRWGARTIDLDILLFGEQVITSERLTVPHPRMFDRAFVLVPLQELAPNLQINGYGNIEALVNATDVASVRVLGDKID